jgi:hypothetical protein
MDKMDPIILLWVATKYMDHDFGSLSSGVSSTSPEIQLSSQTAYDALEDKRLVDSWKIGK